MSRRPEPNHSFHFFGLLLPWLTVRNEHVGSTRIARRASLALVTFGASPPVELICPRV